VHPQERAFLLLRGRIEFADVDRRVDDRGASAVEAADPVANGRRVCNVDVGTLRCLPIETPEP